MFLGQESDAAYYCYCSFYLLIFLILFFEFPRRLGVVMVVVNNVLKTE
jgi:hypothetical protein